MNKTPEQKAFKQRKHRQKVIVEGKPISQNPATQKRKFKENPTKMMKYVRKNVPKIAERPLTVVIKETSYSSATS